jgi:glycosyltransferase involved in cell wall biosynthesis
LTDKIVVGHNFIHIAKIALRKVQKLILISSDNYLDTRFNSDFRTNSPISVIMVTYNQSKEIIQGTVNSLLTQTFLNFNLIIIDDGSTNFETLNYLNGTSGELDSRILVHFKEHSGIASSLNFGISKVCSKYLAFIDPGNSMESTFLEKCFLLSENLKDKNLSLVMTDVVIKSTEDFIFESTDVNIVNFSLWSSLPFCNFLNRKILLKVGGFLPHLDTLFRHDELWNRLSTRGYSNIRLPEPLFKFNLSVLLDQEVSNNSTNLCRDIQPTFSDSIIYSDPKITRYPTFKETKLPLYFSSSEFKASPVIFFVPWLNTDGGVENFLQTLAKGLVDNFKKVIFISTLHSNTSSSLEYIGITPFVYDLHKIMHEKNFLDFVLKLLGNCQSPIIFNCGSAWLYDNLKKITEFRAEELQIYDILFNEVGHLPNFLLHQELFKGVIAVHGQLENLLKGDLRVTPKVHNVPVGVASLTTSSRKEFNKIPRIGWLGRLSPEKRPDWFVKLAKNTKIEASFELAGSGELLGDLTYLSHKSPNLNLLGRVESSLNFLSSLDLLINTSEIEGIPLTAMEALSLGVPVVAPRIGGIPELIINGENGFLYDPNDFDSLISILEFLLVSPQELWSLNQRTQKRKLPKQFHAETMLNSFLKIID